MYPHPTLLFKGKGVTDDPPQESYWKAANGIRLSGMPNFKGVLTDTELWRLAQLVAHANEIPDSAKKVLAPELGSGGREDRVTSPVESRLSGIFAMLEEFNLAEPLLCILLALVWAAQVLSLFGYYLVAFLYFLNHVCPPDRQSAAHE